MSKYLNSLVIGIDVASEFSFAAVIVPDTSQYKKLLNSFILPKASAIFLSK